MLGPSETALKRTAAREILPRERELNPRTGRVNAAIDIVPGAAPEATTAVRAFLDHASQRRQAIADAMRRAGAADPLTAFGVAPAEKGSPLPDLPRRVMADLMIRGDGILISVTIE